ncbi:hypothetical protein AB4342_18565 [Vibrio breoganii]|uniref:hypothetical protein n=1 Tax=Vibrio breoganii TaxID=553239 RepID=UPI000C81E022|nr:hypothetical protein [Vibrio breoganii]PMJ44296.1 hypothetical protein BCU21_16110 [Vibrio breoganii]PMK59419.1 hypothetical protein BCT97_06420 [Vibrio breoganii]PMM86764.1 hypothetical protein BCT45_05630 [Vibrio breoganii]PMO29218.1 hypothetical protein BCT14_06595 [Vibrio breoganii]PMO32946.1 hypothetical protein BCT13_08600 [Vibrio breoganii]
MSSKKRANKALLQKILQQDRPQREMHSELFPEEYDHLYDSNVEVRARNRGENPMSEDYQRKVNLRRFAMGVEPYGGSVGIDDTEGLITSWQYCEDNIAQ